MAAPIITPIPTPPIRSDAPADFATKADAFAAALPQFVTETNTSAAFVDQRAIDADASATAAAASEAAAEAGRAEVAANAATVASHAATVEASATEVAANAVLAGERAAAAAASASESAANAQIAVNAAASIADGPVTSVNGQTGVVSLTPASIGVQAVYLSGPTSAYVTQTKDYTITSFDSFGAYVAQVSAGSVSMSGDTITLTAPTAAQTVTLTVTRDGQPQAFAIEILPASVATPAITSPSAGETGVTETPTITTSAFQAVGLSDTHLNSDWELWTGPNRTGTKVASLYASASSLTGWSIPAGIMQVGTTYYPAALHRGTALGASEWVTSSFTTAATFNSYIPTPAPTPANYGAPFEGGFYAGLFWNELTQATGTKTLATGTQTFTVPDMTGAPIVYAGQTLEVRSRANPANKFIGTVTGAIGTTLTLNVTSIGGSGTFSDWSVMSRYRSIEAPKASGEIAAIALKDANTAFPVACQTLTEGWKATLAMVAAGGATVYPAAHAVRALVINGKDDWYIPARDQRELAWRNLKPVTNSNYVAADRPTGQSFNYANNGSIGDTSASHGVNNNSSPTGAAYTTTNPAQTAATAFRSGGAEAFEFGSAYYWSCSEYSAAYAWGQYWDSSNSGTQYTSSKTSAYRVRAVRRSII